MSTPNNSIPIVKPQTRTETPTFPVNTPTQSVNVSSSEVPVNKPAESKYPSETIELPSQGYFYDVNSPLSSGKLQLRYMTAKDEDILLSENLIKKGTVLDELMKSLIVTPGVNLDDLLLLDKNAIHIYARKLAYGNEYKAKVKCPKCGEENEVLFDLDTVVNKEFDFSPYVKGSNSFDYQLPFSKKNITYKFLTHKDDASIQNEIKQFSQNIKTKVSPEITTRLKYMILSVEGNTDRNYIKKFVDTELIARDSSALREHIRTNSPEIDFKFNFTCTYCGHEERLNIPITTDFYWPSSTNS